MRGLPAGSHFKRGAQIYKRYYQRRGLEIKVPRYLRHGAGKEHDESRIGPGDPRPYGYQRIHVTIMIPEGFPCTSEKTASAVCEDEQGEEGDDSP